MKMIQAQLTAATLFLLMLAVGVSATPIRGIASSVRSDLVLLPRTTAENNAEDSPVQSRTSFDDEDVPAGEALDLFYRYGFYSLSVRVVPRHDPGSWLIREPTAAIFQPDSVRKSIVHGANTLEPQFQIYFCDDIAELNEAYFRDFTAEGIEQPAKLFTSSWHSSTKSKYYGLSKDAFSDGESQFVLVKLSKTRATVGVAGRPLLKSAAAAAAAAIRPGDRQAVLDFVRTYGSHYIKDVVVGDLVYQVLALEPEQYARAKAALPVSLGQFERADDFRAFYDEHLAPWQVRETGQIRVASGDPAAAKWAEERLRIEGQFGSYPDIFALRDNPDALGQLDQLTRDSAAVIGLHFASLRPWVPGIQAMEYYDEVVDTQAALWEANI